MDNDKGLLSRLSDTMSFITAHGIHEPEPELGIILATGLNKIIEEMDVQVSLNYAEIPHFPPASVEKDNGRLIYGRLRGKKTLVMQGHYHYYEGYSMQQITFPIRLMKLLGIHNLMISNLGGTLNENIHQGDLVIVNDHFNFLPDNPLFGTNHEELGPRFPDMCRPYSNYLNEKLINISKEKDIPAHQGIYAAVGGPNLPTKTEYRFLKMVGADIVGMSTVPEVLVANHMKLPCCAVTIVTNKCDPENLEPVNREDITDVALGSEPKMVTLFCNLAEQIRTYRRETSV